MYIFIQLINLQITKKRIMGNSHIPSIDFSKVNQPHHQERRSASAPRTARYENTTKAPWKRV